MGKVSELSDAVRTEIVTKYNLGITVINIAKEYNLPRQTIYYQINKYKQTGKINNLRRTGRKRKTTVPQDRLIVRKFQSNPFLTPKSAALEWNSYYNNHISERTVRRRLKESNISISFKGLGDLVPIDGSMNQNQYLRILNEHAFPNGDRLIGDAFVLQQDNAPCHKSKMITKFLIENCIETLDWPPQSPDLNVIENVWSYIKRKRTADLTRTREETIEEVTKLWEVVPLEFLQSLINSIPNRLQKVIDARGGYIFY